ncbi:uncharacterized protein LOC119174912 isoform X2 [Rhipicephalus microplus]|uniref:uncharacterized protein LOC119174912 isoform X2 n=1 Tax=Rhipicephalus microplus TaxID=6941 RepID=UPI0018879F43|nr:uncharacterized protein LOC119174912 isoform X2 [Rhipicephalus microplus]
MSAELSLQGDDFTRQMWHMYNTFEDVVVGGTLPPTDQPAAGDAQQQQQQHTLPPSQQPPPPAAADDTAAPAAIAVGGLRGDDAATPAQTTAAPRPPKPVRIPSSPDVRRDASSPTASPGARRKKRPMSQRCSYAACGSSGSSTSSSSSGSQQQRSSLSSSGNPLLDTIGSMTYDPCCESDDYYDLASVYLQRRQARQHSDGESIAYAGSIDSGYKSLCPTPEIPDYDAEAKSSSKAAVALAQPSTAAATSRLAAPASAGGQQGHKPTQEELDADLDHLMQLRQSLLTAIARCESPVSPKSSSSSPRAGSAGDKTVRFSTEKLTSAPSCSPAKAPGTRAKPILKDPLCANLRANLERPDSGGTLEEEIDSLLCGGKPDYYDLDARFPPSTYVTMVEEKYRSNAGYSVAKVKCLKDKCQETSKDHNNAALTAEPSRRSQSHSRQQHQKPQHHQLDTIPLAMGTYNPPIAPIEPTVSRSERSVTGHPVPAPRVTATHGMTAAGSVKPCSVKPTIMRSAKSRFNEVAKCMLEIIEDLQHKKITEPRPAKISSSKLSVTATTAASSASQPLRDTHIGGSRGGPTAVQSQQQQQQTQRPLSDSEYHVYEEVLYDFVNSAGSVTSELQRPPPPLPARPSEPGHRPKQRSNLYSLVRNQEERRNISKSLEQEWSGDRAGRLEDEYGFRSVTNS